MLVAPRGAANRGEEGQGQSFHFGEAAGHWAIIPWVLNTLLIPPDFLRP